jgi:hypothetical protein
MRIKLLWFAIVAVVAAAIPFIWTATLASVTPKGQGPLVILATSTDLANVKSTFNRHKDRKRIIAVLSPTCGACLRGASMLDEMLRRSDAYLIVIWEPILRTDVLRPRTAVLAHAANSRVQQYWDPEHYVAKELALAIRAKALAEPQCCFTSGYYWDIAAVFPQGAEWGDSMPPPTLMDGPIVDMGTRLSKVLYQ